MNALNFIDGINGLASGKTMIVASAIWMFSMSYSEPGLAVLSLAIFTSTLGLFMLNYPQGRIFMGDAGAVPLGFYLALLGLVALCIDHTLGWVWLVLMMPFLIDSGFTLCIRLLKGHAPHIAHRDHAYQRLTLRAGSSLPVILGLLAMQVAWQFPLAVTIVTAQVFPPLLVLLSAIPALIAVVYARLSA